MSWLWVVGLVIFAVLIDLIVLPPISKYLHTRQAPTIHFGWLSRFWFSCKRWFVATSPKVILLIRRSFFELTAKLRIFFGRLAAAGRFLFTGPAKRLSKPRPLVVNEPYVEIKDRELSEIPAAVEENNIKMDLPSPLVSVISRSIAEEHTNQTERKASQVEIDVNLSRGQKVTITIESQNTPRIIKTQ